MFVLTKTVTYYWPVSIQVPADGGSFSKESLELKFKRIAQSRLNELMEGAKDESVKDEDFAREVVVGWRGVSDDAGNEIQFSDEGLKALLDIPTMGSAIVISYLESLAGAKAKN